MKLKHLSYHLPFKELLFQVMLNVLVFIFFAFDRRVPGIEFMRIYFFLNYAIAAFIINYFLLPRFLYKRRYWEFIFYVIIAVGLVIFIEEAFLEQIFYPDTRGKKFLGVFYNLLSTMPTLTILVGFKFAWDALIKQQEVQQLKSLMEESELQYLKSQINPHFLFNNLNNLYASAIEKSPATPKIILELSSVLRYMLYDCKAKFVPLKKEIEHLENYINLSQLQIEGRGQVHVAIGNIPLLYQIAPLILSVFVENAFKHSVSSQSGDIKIHVELTVGDNGKLFFVCKNSYLDQSNTDSLDHGIGLDNVRKRLTLIYPDSHVLNIDPGIGQYEVELTIDLTVHE